MTLAGALFWWVPYYRPMSMREKLRTTPGHCTYIKLCKYFYDLLVTKCFSFNQLSLPRKPRF